MWEQISTLLKSVLGMFVPGLAEKVEQGAKIIPFPRNKPIETAPETVSNQEEKKMPRTINQEGLNLIKQSEGLRLKAYKDVVGILTIGYGSTGVHVTEGKVITEPEAEELLKEDLKRFEEGVSKLVTVALTDNQFSALVSFSFNVGLGNLKSSTLLRKLNAGESGVPNEFLKWNKAGGKVYPGLTKRREAERQLFST